MKEDVSMNLMQGFDFEALKPIKQKVRDSTAFNDEGLNKFDDAQELSYNVDNKPSKNVLELADGMPDTS
jgi:hypothetical protein